jgi:superfamily II DNA or RNA helicase
MLSLRDYQAEAIETIEKEYAAGVTRQLVVLPTGSGKTIIFAHLVLRMGVPALILVHRDELISQTAEKLAVVFPEADVGIVKGPSNELGHMVTLASVQTLSREERLRQVRQEFGLVVADEAHHAVAPQWRRILEHVRAGEGSLLLGVTATPVRADGIGLGNIFDKVVYQKAIPEMIRAGYLCPPKGLVVRSETDISGVRDRDGDFAAGALESVINTANRNELIAQTFKEHAASRKAIVFTAGVAHAHDLAAAFREGGVSAVAVDGSMPLDERRRILKDFRQGKVRVVTNCGVLVEGFDEPSADCVVLARPTKSEALYIQAVGRGLRPYPGKKDCLVLDVADVSGRHKLVQLADIMGPDWTPKRKAPVQKSGQGEAMRELEFDFRAYGRSLVAEEVELITKYTWIQAESGVWVLPYGGRNNAVLLVPHGDGYLPVHVSDGRREPLHNRPLPIEWAQGVAEGKIRELTEGKGSLVRKDARWRDLPPTEKQLELLKKMRVGVWPGITRGEAADAINRVIWGKKASRFA